MTTVDHQPASGRHLGNVLDLMRALWAVDHGLRATSRRMRRDLGLTGSQRFALRLIGRCPDLTAGELARLLHVHPSTLTDVLERLEHAGLLIRHGDASDGRRARLELTTRGRALDRRLAGTVEASVRRVVASLPPGRVSSARALLEALAAELQSGARLSG